MAAKRIVLVIEPDVLLVSAIGRAKIKARPNKLTLRRASTTISCGSDRRRAISQFITDMLPLAQIVGVAIRQNPHQPHVVADCESIALPDDCYRRETAASGRAVAFRRQGVQHLC